MAGIRLPKLPDRSPVKLTVLVLPELHQQLGEYAALYQATYGSEESIADLIPHMLAAFLASDRAFAKARAAAPRSD